MRATISSGEKPPALPRVELTPPGDLTDRERRRHGGDHPRGDTDGDDKRLVMGVGDRALVWVHGPVRLGTSSVPEPDLAVVRPRSYKGGGPTPADVLLIVAVADTSLRYDQTTKLRLYAGAGIPEYWIVSVDGEWVDVYRSPEGDGYRERRRAASGERVSPAAFSDVDLAVTDVFA